MINLTINGKPIQAEEGMTILQAAAASEIGRASCRETV